MLVRLAIVFFLVAVAAGCSHTTSIREHADKVDIAFPADDIATNQSDANDVPETPSETAEEYAGITIDEVFQISSSISSIDENGRESEFAMELKDWKVQTADYVPRTLSRDGAVVFKFKEREPEGYWATVAGISNLRGNDKSEIYMAVSGPGGVCCTNYSIIDISSERPKSLYHSEDFGRFREPMEIFDADGDGTYELMQFDSCFRYFMDDCGSCSPEPRAYFKYDKTKAQYLPAAGITQDFVSAGYRRSDEWLSEKHAELQRTGDVGLRLDIRRSALAHMVDLLFIGEEKKAWSVFDRYIDDPAGKTRREINKRLAGCKFYQALRRTKK